MKEDNNTDHSDREGNPSYSRPLKQFPRIHMDIVIKYLTAAGQIEENNSGT